MSEAKTKVKPNCYDCEYRREIPGDCHSRCAHPSVKPAETNEDRLFELLAAMGRKTPPRQIEGITVQGHEQGIRGGWFCWPYNFDPVWLTECSGFKRKGELSERDK